MSEDMPFLSHLDELRTCLVRSFIAWIIAFVACYSYSGVIFSFISEPVRRVLPEGSSMVFISATEPFFTYLKISALSAMLFALPVILWQLWAFIAPGLYKHEKRYAIPFVFASCLCFACGTYFGFTFVFPTIFNFLVTFGTSSGDMQAMLSIGNYLSLASKLLLAFGLVFELPIIIFFLARLGVVDHLWLKRNRKFALLIAFVVGAMLTPPDILSQTALAVPFIILYEVGIIVARLFGKKREADSDEDDETPQATDAS
ncbi:MAG: twin-arginine translocase subunit TatC [Desulfuromonas sp.]|mgnify:CR=1 FL=1|nr:MAG: twin-arginine translocase subunit TatC [Desulfuromonas sp.]